MTAARRTAVALAIAATAAATVARAEPWGPQMVTGPGAAPTRARVVALAVALDGPARLDGGYGRVVFPRWLPGALTLGAHLRLPWSPDPGDVAIGGSAGLDAPIAGGWRIRPALALTWRRADGALLGVDQLALGAGLAAGYVAARWHAGATLGWDHALVTRAAPTDGYLMMVPTARTAVTAGGGGTLRAGGEAGVGLGGGAELLLRAGVLRSDALATIPGLPLYVELAGAVRF